MFKIKTLIITLTFSPLIVLFHQLTSFAQVSSPDAKMVGTASSTSESGKIQESATGIDSNPTNNQEKITLVVSANNLRELRNTIQELIPNSSDSLSASGIFSIRSSLISDGVSPLYTDTLLGLFVKVLSQLDIPGNNFSATNLNGEKLVASTNLVQDHLAEGETALILDYDNLMQVIDIYNKIVLETDDPTIIKLSRNPHFLKISKILKTLRRGTI
ncbi:hypothetical protein GSN00_15250 [Cylindrospermopsis raciborskii CHAB3438]|jgi:hypothetical protein|uniref:hypothetical protein n=1 Tax=Cylindrospermopsis raciborskii TaxID=77022 RepID=UPI000E1FAC0A|nr:hypothetical protein [Cylindrospermopsis raciborskii]MCH4905683.1 hypothetical protein [Cylindrospermopsis raciborskii CHAB3438]MEB3146077.1 hypothetical protein [Cylindrospermopsis raciborskii]TPX29382.1 hypothetical protein FIV49_03130 [Cylindrospermopsis raciborskii GIHE 2018]UJL32545.1 hypothetical protein C6N34_010115 [Cylindrospermopsis raciborskii Cr2010]UJS04999.1 hypothetical protein L3I90_01700 [Cylindrospermopsis raciborskii KLL07]